MAENSVLLRYFIQKLYNYEPELILHIKKFIFIEQYPDIKIVSKIEYDSETDSDYDSDDYYMSGRQAAEKHMVKQRKITYKLRECYLCCDKVYKTDINEYSTYDYIIICSECEWLYIENESNGENQVYYFSEMVRTERKCNLCHEIEISVKLPCKHTICIDCYKIIYFGSNDEDQPLHRLEYTKTKPYDPFNYKVRIDYDDYLNRYLESKNINSINDFTEADLDIYKLEIEQDKIKFRPWWMENMINRTWEFKYLTVYIEDNKNKKKWDDWITVYKSNKTIDKFKCIECF